MPATVFSQDPKQNAELIRSRWNFSSCRWIKMPEPQTIPQYDKWLSDGFAGEMTYLARHRDTKADPQRILPNLKSAICLTKSYVPTPNPHDKLTGLRLASYARSQDYHTWLTSELEAIADCLRADFPGHSFFVATDSRPILERDLAAQAGLGWIGKNTCLIDRKAGSFFFLAEILTTVPLTETAQLEQDFCGNCTRCLDACPTQAFVSPRVLDATRCISYWTIEAKSVAPPALRSAMQDWFFGCDICQTVCPWNQKAFKNHEVLETSPPSSQTESELRQILNSSDEELRQIVANTPLERAKPWGLRRNAIIVATNLGLKNLRESIESCAHDERLRELCDWSRAKLTQGSKVERSEL